MRRRRHLGEIKRPGDFVIIETPGDRRIIYRCPKGRADGGELCGVALAPDKLPNGHSWQWNGDREKPTLTPSINCVGGCGWHGFIRNGDIA